MAEGISGPSRIVVDAGIIESVEPGSGPTGPDDIVAPDLVIGAGMIDIHTHGIAGAQTIDGRREAIATIARAFARHGVTGFLATIGGAPATTEAAIRAVVEFIEAAPPPDGARCLGIHLEGPFINPARPGAFVPETIRAPDLVVLDRLIQLGGGHLRRITLAPEVAGMERLIDAAKASGITCSAGHSDATVDEATRAVDRGVTSVTHLYNAMRALHHREPGLVGAALIDDRVTVELIPDGVHVSPVAMRLVARAKGWQRIALITDSIAAAGLDDGSYAFEEQQITVRGGEARLTDGTLAGSTLTLDDGVRRYAAATGVPWHEAHASASLTPASLLGLEGRHGRVAAGMAADLVAFDAAHHVGWTMIAGEIVARA